VRNATFYANTTVVKIEQTAFAYCRCYQWWKLSFFLLRRQKTWIVYRNNQN